MAARRQSAGILLYRKTDAGIAVFLVHPGGPYWKEKDDGAWSIPKGEFGPDEDPLAAAKREFKEETGQDIEGNFLPLQPVKLKSGKMVYAWAVEGEIVAETVVSNTFRQEYPYKSGKWITVPEVDKAAWLSVNEARAKINSAQAAFIDELLDFLEHEETI